MSWARPWALTGSGFPGRETWHRRWSGPERRAVVRWSTWMWIAWSTCGRRRSSTSRTCTLSPKASREPKGDSGIHRPGSAELRPQQLVRAQDRTGVGHVRSGPGSARAGLQERGAGPEGTGHRVGSPYGRCLRVLRHVLEVLHAQIQGQTEHDQPQYDLEHEQAAGVEVQLNLVYGFHNPPWAPYLPLGSVCMFLKCLSAGGHMCSTRSTSTWTTAQRPASLARSSAGARSPGRETRSP